MEILRARGMCHAEWVSWFNTQRLLEPIGYLPPAEYEAQYCARTNPDLAELVLK